MTTVAEILKSKPDTQVHSVAPSDTVLNEIKAALRDVAKADVAVDVKIDPSLIGGLIVKMGSRMVDASVRTKLNSIRLAMKEVR